MTQQGQPPAQTFHADVRLLIIPLGLTVLVVYKFTQQFSPQILLNLSFHFKEFISGILYCYPLHHPNFKNNIILNRDFGSF